MKFQFPAAWQAALALMLRKVFQDMGFEFTANDLCEQLGVGRTTAYNARAEIIDRLKSIPHAGNQIAELKKELDDKNARLKDQEFLGEVYKYRLDNPKCIYELKRQHYTEEFKRFILDLKKEYGFTNEKVSKLLDIPVDTLKKYLKAVETIIPVSTAKELPPEVVELVNIYLHSIKGGKKRSVKDFCKKNPDVLKQLNMTVRQVTEWLSKLGFVRKGRFIKNNGLDRIIRFRPNSVWGTDGKQVNIIINRISFKWVWQCLIDYKTTVIVGGLIAKSETTDNLLKAISESKEKTGHSPLAIVLDNRLSENLPAIRTYLDELNIKIIKTYPRNAKSNGIIENNFNIFERWVGGSIVINAKDDAELSQAIACTLIEVFTQMRNNNPRKCISMKTPAEAMNEAIENPPSAEEIQTIKGKLQEQSDRFKRDEAMPIIGKQKTTAIDIAVNETRPPDEETFRKMLKPSIYHHNLILSAIAIYKQRCQENPEKNYDHTYFGGILRNLADQQSVEHLDTHLEDIYIRHWESQTINDEEAVYTELRINPWSTFLKLAQDYAEMVVPAYCSMILLQMKECFLMASKGSAAIATALRKELSNMTKSMRKHKKKKRVSLLCKIFEWENLVKTYETGFYQ